MDHLTLEGARGEIAKVRYGEIASYLSMPDFKRTGSELPNITTEERQYLSHILRDIYHSSKKEANAEAQLRLMTRFQDCLMLLLCDPIERKMAFSPPEVVLEVVLEENGQNLSCGTGTMGENIYFETKTNEKDRHPNRYMRYPHPGSGAKELGRKYFKRFNESFGTNEVNLDELVLEDL